MTKREIKRLLILSIPYVVFGLISTNLGEAWRMAKVSVPNSPILGMMGALPAAFGNLTPSFQPFDLCVGVAGDGDGAAVALPGLVDGVGEDLEYGVLTALQPVGAENDAGPLSDAVRALETGNAVVVVYVLLWHRGKTSKGCRIHIADSPIYCNAFSAAAQGACRRFPAPPDTFLV